MDAEFRKALVATNRVRRTLATLVVAVLFLVGRSAHATTISAPFVTVNNGDTFTVDISVADALDLTAWQFDLAFDPTIVEVNSVTEGPFLSSFTPSGFTTFTPGLIDNASGLISGVFGSFDDVAPLPAGSGVLANIEFHALAPGISPLTFSSVFLDFADQGFDVTGGQISVLGPNDSDGGSGGDGGGGTTPTPVPEPATLLLFVTGGGLMAARSKRRRTGALAVGFAIVGSMVTAAPAAAQFSPANLPPIDAMPAFELVTNYPPTTATSAAGPLLPIPSRDQALSTSQRFIILTNFHSDAVLDRETGLVWTRQNARLQGEANLSWTNADRACHNLKVGSRGGWRLPTRSELGTLVDPSRIDSTLSYPALPDGHPFYLFESSHRPGTFLSFYIYWTSEEDQPGIDTVWTVDLGTGYSLSEDSPLVNPAICVRGRP